MTRTVCLVIAFFSSSLFIKISAQSDSIKSTDEWRLFKIGETDMEIRFPGEPDHDVNNSSKKVEQYTRKLYGKDLDGYNFVYFISVVKFNSKIQIDSITFVNAISTMVHNRFKDTYNFEVSAQRDESFKDCAAKSTKAVVQTDDNDKFIYEGLSIRRENYVVFMFVLTDPGYVDSDGRVSFFFNSLAWKE